MLLSNYQKSLSSPLTLFWSFFFHFFFFAHFVFFFPKRAPAVHSLIFCSDSASFRWIGLRWNHRPIPFVQLFFSFFFLLRWHAIIHSLTVHFPLFRKHEVHRRSPGLEKTVVDVFKYSNILFKKKEKCQTKTLKPWIQNLIWAGVAGWSISCTKIKLN